MVKFILGKKEVKTYQDRCRKTFLLPKNKVRSPSCNTEVRFMTHIPMRCRINKSQIQQMHEKKPYKQIWRCTETFHLLISLLSFSDINSLVFQKSVLNKSYDLCNGHAVQKRTQLQRGTFVCTSLHPPGVTPPMYLSLYHF